MDLGLKDRVYIVTAASRGLGRATAQVLVDEGAKVVISSRSAASIEIAAQELDSDNAVGVAVDNSDPTAPRQLIAAARTRFGRLDGVLISVGGPPAGAILDKTDAEWRAAFDAVFLGGLRLATEIAGELSAGGSIVFVLSTSVKQPIAGLAISNGLRPGLAMAAKTLADELGPRGIRVNGLLPGRIDTERVRELDSLGADPQSTREAHYASIPLRRYGQPEEFGRIAAFVLSPAASYLNGAMIGVDGGITRGL
ncbi:MAG: SDR family oxidoreductase [Propionibacteriales bacterium]|nr:SDR family oxidoreductase [Propionibacteriales bacterium]